MFIKSAINPSFQQIQGCILCHISLFSTKFVAYLICPMVVTCGNGMCKLFALKVWGLHRFLHFFSIHFMKISVGVKNNKFLLVQFTKYHRVGAWLTQGDGGTIENLLIIHGLAALHRVCITFYRVCRTTAPRKPFRSSLAG